MSRAWTTQECEDKFLKHIHDLVNYWSNVEGTRTVHDRLDGLAFSILAAIDGCSLAFPGINLTFEPHPDNKAYNQSEGDNWYEPGTVINERPLHEFYYKR